MKTRLAGSRVVVKTEQGAYIGGTFWASSPGGNLFVKKQEICLDVDFASHVSAWEILRKPEMWHGNGEIVDDPRERNR
jgi:hypothetical protein